MLNYKLFKKKLQQYYENIFLLFAFKFLKQILELFLNIIINNLSFI